MYFTQSLPELVKWKATPGRSGEMNALLPHTAPPISLAKERRGGGGAHYVTLTDTVKLRIES